MLGGLLQACPWGHKESDMTEHTRTHTASKWQFHSSHKSAWELVFLRKFLFSQSFKGSLHMSRPCKTLELARSSRTSWFKVCCWTLCWKPTRPNSVIIFLFDVARDRNSIHLSLLPVTFLRRAISLTLEVFPWNFTLCSQILNMTLLGPIPSSAFNLISAKVSADIIKYVYP